MMLVFEIQDKTDGPIARVEMTLVLKDGEADPRIADIKALLETAVACLPKSLKGVKVVKLKGD